MLRHGQNLYNHLIALRQRALAVKLVDLAVGNLRGLDQAAGELFAHRVDVHAARPFGVFRVRFQHMDIENEPGFILGGEPVNVVFVVGDRREFTGSETRGRSSAG